MPVKTVHFLRPFHGERLRFKVFFCAIGNEFLVADAIARSGKAAILFSELCQPLVRYAQTQRFAIVQGNDKPG